MHDTELDPGRSDADECQPYYFTYIDLVSDGHVLKLLDRVITLLRGCAPADWTLRSVRAIAYTMAGHELHHLASIRRQHGT